MNRLAIAILTRPLAAAAAPAARAAPRKAAGEAVARATFESTPAIVKLGVTLGEGPSSLFHEGGPALVVHADPDDMKTDPAGNAGARIACGVVARAS